MHARVPAELKAPLEREIRRIRLRSAWLLYVPGVAIFAGLAILGILWKGHALLYLLSLMFGEDVFSPKFLRYSFFSLVGASAVAMFFLMRHIVTKELFQDFHYCKRCDAFDFDEVGVCPICECALEEKASFFYLEFDDERKTLESFGLKETRKEPNQTPEPTAPSGRGSS